MPRRCRRMSPAQPGWASDDGGGEAVPFFRRCFASKKKRRVQQGRRAPPRILLGRRSVPLRHRPKKPPTEPCTTPSRRRGRGRSSRRARLVVAQGSDLAAEPRPDTEPRRLREGRESGASAECGKEMGVTDFVNSKACGKPVHEVIREMTDGGVDYSFECTGINDVLRETFLSTHEGWGLTVVLGIHATPQMMPLHPMELFHGRRITGCVFGDFKGKSELPELVDKCMNGEVKINFDGFITHKMPFSDINYAFQLLEEGKSLRCLLHF